MSNRIKRKQSEISRQEWIIYNWVNVQEVQDEEPVYIRTTLRQIAKSLDAAQQWDEWRKAYEELHPELKQTVTDA